MLLRVRYRLNFKYLCYVARFFASYSEIIDTKTLQIDWIQDVARKGDNEQLKVDKLRIISF